MLVKDIMSSPAIAVSPDTNIAAAAKLMLDNGISGLPVIDAGGQLQGIVSEADFLRRSELDTEKQRPRWLEYLVDTARLADEYARAHGRKVEEVMHEDPVTCAPEEPLSGVVEKMLKHRVKRLPVVADGKVVGMLARSDILKGLASVLPPAAEKTASDEQIRSEIQARVRHEAWPSRLVTISVLDGVVTLEGTVFDQHQQQALHVLTENVPGVKSVVDRLLWIEPLSATVIGPIPS